MRILVTGASGLVGTAVVQRLQAAGHEVVATSRDPARHRFPAGVTAVAWDGGPALAVPGRLDGVINLAGAGIMDRRWTAGRKKELRRSRITLTRHLVAFLERLPPTRRPGVLVSQSAVGYYGIRTGPVTEDSAPGEDFLARLCQEWEAEAHAFSGRVVTFRTGHVLAAGGGYLGKLLPLARFGLAGRLGKGDQPMPWVHADDVAGAMVWALGARVRGPFNLVAPQAIDQRTFAAALGRAMGKRQLPVPALALRVRFGPASRPILGGQAAHPERLVGAGYRFEHQDIKKALGALVSV